MLLATLGTSLLSNLLAGKSEHAVAGATQAFEGTIRTGATVASRR